jgi:hypothetical protein
VRLTYNCSLDYSDDIPLRHFRVYSVNSRCTQSGVTLDVKRLHSVQLPSLEEFFEVVIRGRLIMMFSHHDKILLFDIHSNQSIKLEVDELVSDFYQFSQGCAG